MTAPKTPFQQSLLKENESTAKNVKLNTVDCPSLSFAATVVYVECQCGFPGGFQVVSKVPNNMLAASKGRAISVKKLAGCPNTSHNIKAGKDEPWK